MFKLISILQNVKIKYRIYNVTDFTVERREKCFLFACICVLRQSLAKEPRLALNL